MCTGVVEAGVENSGLDEEVQIMLFDYFLIKIIFSRHGGVRDSVSPLFLPLPRSTPTFIA